MAKGAVVAGYGGWRADGSYGVESRLCLYSVLGALLLDRI